MEIDVEQIRLTCCTSNDVVFPNLLRERLSHVLVTPVICFSNVEMAVLDCGQEE